MRILYIDVNILHINPTANLFPLMLLNISNDVTFYGPGYVNKEVVEEGILKFLKKHKQFEIVIYGPTCPMLCQTKEEDIVNYCKVSSANNLSSYSLLIYFKDIIDNFMNLEINIQAISTLNYDYYSDPGKVLDIIDKNQLYLIGPNDKSMSLLKDLPAFVKKEKHYKRKLGKFSNRWFKYISANPQRNITALHFVSTDELFFEPLNSRNYDISIPGVEYYLRKKAIKELKSSNFKIFPQTIFNLYRVLNFFKLKPYSYRFAINYYKMSFQNQLRNSKCVYTAHGGFGIPIRKFFEIPASGSLLICNPCIGFEDLGFVSNKNYIKADPEELIDMLNFWINNANGQEVASAGRDMIFAKHSIKARSEQIKNCFTKILLNEFSGSWWVKGTYIIK